MARSDRAGHDGDRTGTQVDVCAQKGILVGRTRNVMIISLATAVAVGGSAWAAAAGTPATAHIAARPASSNAAHVGKRGPRGPVGHTGRTGSRGPAGPAGARGAIGLAGADGLNGQAGANGNTVLHGTGGPGATTGSVGDFYIDTQADAIYGPKSSSSWGSATSLVGAPGQNGSSSGGTSLLSASGDATLQTDDGMGDGPVSQLLPLSGVVDNSTASLNGGDVYGQGNRIYSVLPTAGTLTDFVVSSTNFNSSVLFLNSTIVTVTAQLYLDPTGGYHFAPVASAECALPAIAGGLNAAQAMSCSATGLSVPIAAGTTGVIVVTATADDGSAHPVQLHTSVSMSIAG